MENIKSITPRLFFEETGWQFDENSRLYLAERVKNADEKSEFGKKTGGIRKLELAEIANMLDIFHHQDYEILMGYQEQDVVGHIAFQEHNNGTKDWNIFQVYVKEKHRGEGYAHQLTQGVIEKGFEYGVNKIRVGKPNSEKVTQSLMKKLRGEETSLGIETDLESHLVYLK